MSARSAVLLAALVVPVLTATAYATPLLPRSHSEDVVSSPRGALIAVHIDGDLSSVRVTPGASTRVSAHLEWTTRRPTLTVAVRQGVLTVTARCDDAVVHGPVVYVGGPQSCVDDLQLVVPAAAALRVTTGGPVSATDLRGPLDLQGAATSVTRVSARLVRIHSSGAVTLDHVVAPVLQAGTTNGDLRARAVRGAVVSLASGYGRVEVADVQAQSLTARSDQGAVSVTAARVAGAVDASSGYGPVAVRDLQARTVHGRSDQGDVTVDESTVTGPSALSSGYGRVAVSGLTSPDVVLRSDQGDVSVQRLRGLLVEASSGYGTVAVEDVHVGRVTARSDQGNVVVRVLDVPSLVRATSGYGTVGVHVPAGRYAVDATSGYGRATVSGLITDSSATRFVVAHSDQGDVSVVGV